MFQRKQRAARLIAICILGFGSSIALGQQNSGIRYALEISWGSSSSMLVSWLDVVPGQPVRVRVGDQILVMRVLPISDSEYELRVGAEPTRTATEVSTFVASSRRAEFGALIGAESREGAEALPGDAIVRVVKLSE